MSACVVWIDSENAKIFKISPDGTIKNHIHSHTTHPIGHKHDHLIFKNLVGVEALDHLSDNQMLEASRKFFKKYNTFNLSI